MPVVQVGRCFASIAAVQERLKVGLVGGALFYFLTCMRVAAQCLLRDECTVPEVVGSRDAINPDG
jgi:hypothetical protein